VSVGECARGPVTAAWRVWLADRIAGGMIGRLRADREALRAGTRRALTILGAVLADPAVRDALPERRLRYWADQYIDIVDETRP
jgi:hypothetical protein